MTASLPQFVLFDHVGGSNLQSLAEMHGFQRLATTATGDAKDGQAKVLLLRDSNWRIAFVHILDDPWNDLCRGAFENQVLLRLSTQGYPPVRPEGVKALCLHCTKKLEELRAEDVGALKSVLNDSPSCIGLRTGVIPHSVRHLIAFENPHRLRALHILMQGVLATWASDPGHGKSSEALACLGPVSIPPLPSRDIGKCLTTWRALGLETSVGVTSESADALRSGIARELGAKDLNNELAIKALVDSICSGNAAASLDETTVINGFKALDQMFKAMITKAWSRARSDFNHAWLKNRFIVSLSKAQKVLEGAVQDDAIWDDVSGLLAEWPARKAEALRVLEDYPEAVSPRKNVESDVGVNIDTETTNWLAELAHQRWSVAEQPEECLSKAREAMAALDAQIEVVNQLLPDARRKESLDKLAKALVELQIAASCLGGAFSALGGHAV